MAARAHEDDLAYWLDRTRAAAARHARVDAYEVRADEKHDRAVARLDGRTTNSAASSSTGLGVHIFASGGSAFVHTTDLDDARIAALIDRGVDLAAANGRRKWRRDAPRIEHARSPRHVPDLREPPVDADADTIVAVLERAEAAAREAEPEARVATAFGAATRRILYTDSAASWAERTSVVSTLRVTAALASADGLVDGMSRRAGERGVGDYEDQGGPEAIGAEAAQRAREATRAVGFPSGRYRVLCDNHLTGMLAHESFGHLTEYDLVSCGWSTLQGRTGEQLAAADVSVTDAPVSPHDPRQGVHVPFDDQGTPGRAVTMLDRGVLKRYLHTRDSAFNEEDEGAGNGRALDSRFPSIVRMRNTYFEPGNATVDEALEALGDGVYLIGARGGAPYSDGSFMFTSIRGYLVEGGEITTPVRSTSIHGNVLDFLQNVEMLTRDFDVYTNYFGGCGKRDQSFLHVGVGGPHILVDNALLGGHGA